MTVRKIKGYGWRGPSLPDHRDLIFNNLNVVLPDHQLQGMVDLSASMPPIYDQLQLGSCTANGWARVMEFMAMHERLAVDTPSRLFIYYNERVLEGTDPSQDSGASVRTGAQVVSKMGVPPESEWQYSDADPGPFQQKPPDNVYQDALKLEALQYQKIIVGTPGAPMRTALSSGYPIVFGFPVPDYFEGGWDPANEVLPLPKASTNIIGGHCMTLTGYDFTMNHWPVPVFQADNSWGDRWGIAGRCVMDYRWFRGDNSLATDMWIVKKVS